MTTAAGDQLELAITAPRDYLSRPDEVVASLLVRFGERGELSVDATLPE